MTAGELVTRIERWTQAAHPRTWGAHTWIVLWLLYLPVRGLAGSTAGLVAGVVGCLGYVVREALAAYRAWGGPQNWGDRVGDVLAPMLGVVLLHRGLGP